MNLVSEVGTICVTIVEISTGVTCRPALGVEECLIIAGNLGEVKPSTGSQGLDILITCGKYNAIVIGSECSSRTNYTICWFGYVVKTNSVTALRGTIDDVIRLPKV